MGDVRIWSRDDSTCDSPTKNESQSLRQNKVIRKAELIICTGGLHCTLIILNKV